MKNPEDHIDVLIVGGGPVGLFLAICLLKEGIHCQVLEKRRDPIPDSRSLGIHPVSLELFDELGITDAFLESGLKIKKGIAHTGLKKLGEISFEQCPGPHNYILACPQFTTEKILRSELQKLNERALITGSEFLEFSKNNHSLNVSYRSGENKLHNVKANWLIGCDGKNSLVRQKASIHYSGKRYHDTYIMGDFDDTTDFGNDAAVFLPKDGLIECFPLPSGMRRWVIKTDSYINKPTQEDIATLVKDRLGYNLHSIESTMISSFGVQHFMAETFAKGRVILAGDAAHVVSPIGGQGMNSGWLDCREILRIFKENRHDSKVKDIEPMTFNSYSEKQKKVVRKVARRAEINMALGRKRSIPALRNLFIQWVLRSPLKNKIAELFTMRGLEQWWI